MFADTAKGESIPLPGVFQDPGFLLLRHDGLSTSSIFSPCIDYFSFPPVVADGLGVGYLVKDDALHLAITSYAASGVAADKFIDSAEEAAKRLLGIL
jgi:hypothetical protein